MKGRCCIQRFKIWIRIQTFSWSGTTSNRNEGSPFRNKKKLDFSEHYTYDKKNQRFSKFWATKKITYFCGFPNSFVLHQGGADLALTAKIASVKVNYLLVYYSVQYY